MSRTLLSVLSVLALGVAGLVWADDKPKAPPEALTKDDASIKQEQLGRQFREFEQLLLRMAQRMEASSKQEDRDKAAIIKKAIQKARESDVDNKFDKLVSLFRDPKQLDLDSIQTIGDQQKMLIKDLQEIIAILLTDNRDAELKAERERISNLLKKLGELIRQQQTVRALTERKTLESKRLSREQKDVKDATDKLAKQMGKPGNSKDGKGEPKDAKGEPKDSKPSAGKPGEGQPKEGQPKEGQPKDQKKDDDQQQQGKPTPGRKQIEDAIENMKKAIEEIEKKKNDKASDEQDEAIKKLKEAQKKLEELLAQLREEELERLLAALQQRCERMLAMQIEVRDGTISVYKVVEATPDKKGSRTEVQRSLQLSDREDEIAREATKAIAILEAEGSAVAFPEVFHQIRSDMLQVSARLRKTDVGVVTQTIEQDIIDTLKEMIEALKKQQQDNKDKKNKPSQGGQKQNQNLIDLLAELKMIRSVQIRINNRTKTYAREYPDAEQAPAIVQAKSPEEREKAEMLQREMNDLSHRQLKLFEVTNDLARGKAEANRAQ